MPIGPNQLVLNGKYRMLKLIGEGGMAHVWLADEPHFDRGKVAIKEVLNH